MAKLSINDFVNKFFMHANLVAERTGVPALVTLTQAALESGWGEKAHQYNFFGLTAGTNFTGKKQLLQTVEYHKDDKQRYPEIISITYQTSGTKTGYYKYVVKRWFRAYDTPADAFLDYARVLSESSRYADAFKHTNNPEKFLQVVSNAGYATNSNYYSLALQVMYSIKKRVA